MSLKNIRDNIIMLTDAYNPSHTGLKINTDFEVSHMYNRKDGMILYGLNEIIGEYFTRQVTMDMVNEAHMHAITMGIPFPRDLWVRVVEEMNGYLPLKIETLPEGTWCPAGTPFAQISNTVKGFGELVTWLEAILMHGWFPSSVATEAFKIRRYLEEHKLPLIKVHSFGFRGHQNVESAYWAGTAFNLFLVGTDDFHSTKHTPLAKMGSIPALAHKVTQQYDDEFECFTHAIDYAKECGSNIVALVIDTYDSHRVIHTYLPLLLPYAKHRGVHIVLRPDSGNTIQQAIEIYDVVNDMGYDNANVIIGEGIDFQKIRDNDHFLATKGVPLDFVNYGIGAGLYKHLERDTLGWAMKTAYSNGKPRMKFSEVELKRSIPSEVKVIRNSDGLLEVESRNIANGGHGLYETVYFYTGFDADLACEPMYHKSVWSQTQERALSNLDKHLQQRIVISSHLKELIQTFRETYKG